MALGREKKKKKKKKIRSIYMLHHQCMLRHYDFGEIR